MIRDICKGKKVQKKRSRYLNLETSIAHCLLRRDELLESSTIDIDRCWCKHRDDDAPDSDTSR